MNSRCKIVLIVLACVAAAALFITSGVVVFILRINCHCKSTGYYSASCPSGWVWYQGSCYYFSEDRWNWTSSEDFCSSYNSSLVTIENDEIEDFLGRFKCSENYWLGLKKDGQSWKWLNGHHAKLEIIGDGGDCAILTNSSKIQASVTSCSTRHQWICYKSDV